MTIKFLAADNESILYTDDIVWSSLAYPVKAILPGVSGSGAPDIAVDQYIVVAAAGKGSIEVVDELGRRVWTVRPYSSVILRSTSQTVARSPAWSVERPAIREAAKIADLAATNTAGQVAASAVDFAATYVQAAVTIAGNTAIQAVADSAATKFNATLTELEAKYNMIMRGIMIGLGVGPDNTVAAGQTLALAASDVSVLQAVEDDDKLVTSARAYDTTAVLPDVVDGATGTAVDDGYTIRFEANSTGGIRILDFDHKFVGYVKPYTNAHVVCNLNSQKEWMFMPQDGYEIPLGVETVPFLQITRVTAPTAAFAAPAAYTDAAFNTAAKTAFDAVGTSLNTQLDAAFDQIDAFVVVINETLEGADVMAES